MKKPEPMINTEEKKFYMLCSYREAGKPVGNDELRDAFDEAVYEMAYFEPEVGDDGEVDQLGYLEDLDNAETSVAESMLDRMSPEIKSILLSHEEA